MMLFRPVQLLPALALAAIGCQKESVQSYVAPKDPVAAPPPAHATHPGSARPDEPRTGKPPWTVPEGWVEKPVEGGIRRASYGVSAQDGRSADISVVLLSGEAGGSLTNLNRWRDQLKLAPIDADQLGKFTETTRVGSREVSLYEVVSETPILEGKFKARTLAAVLPAGDTTVFFKMTGEDALVTENRPKFIQWLNSVDLGEREEPADPPPTAGTPPETGSATPVSSGQAAQVKPPPSTGIPTWETPSHWQPGPPASMRVASFLVPGEGGQSADLSVIALGPQAGTVLANVNRWRGQVGLAPMEESGLAAASTKVTLRDGEATVVDMVGEISPKGEKKRTRILAAIVPRPDRTWFYKLTGDDSLVAREKEAFLKFLRSVKY